MNTETVLTFLQTKGLELGMKVLGAFAIWVIGRWVIRGALSLLDRGLNARNTDPTLVRYAHSMLSITLTIALVVALLSFFGVETTSFAALIAAAGVAIGMAWSGLLANFAAGVFLLILKPFKVGDLISAGGVLGTVQELGLFATTLETVDGVKTFVGNNKVFADNIQNFSNSPARRVDLVAQLAHGVNPAEAKQLLASKLAQVPHVLATPAPTIEILEFNAMGTLLAVRPHTHNNHYWDVYFATNKLIAESFGAAGFPVPYTQQRLIDTRPQAQA